MSFGVKIFDRYITKQVFAATLVCIVLFVVIWIAPETLLKVIKRTLAGIYTPWVGVQLLINEIPKIVGKALPVGLLLGTLFTFDKLSKDFELTDVMLKQAVSSLDAHSRYLSALFPDDEKLRFSRDFAARMLDGDVLYIKIKVFTKITPQNVKNALMQNQFLLKAIIIDLRDCKGGALAAAIDTAKLFMNYGVIAVTKGKNQSDKAVFMADESGVIAGVPMVILVDAATASSAEVFASAMQENALATVWGTQTYGKGTVQNIVSLPDDNKMLLTNAYVYSPSGKEINGVGILPDVCLYRAKDSAKLDDVMQEFSVCPKEVRGDRRIDIDLAKSFLLAFFIPIKDKSLSPCTLISNFYYT